MKAQLQLAVYSFGALVVLAACKGGQPSAASTSAPAVTPPETSSGPTQERPVAVELIADTDRVGSGQEFAIGVRFTIADGWGLLWENPGEMGIPSRIVFEAPAGYEVSATRYPGPSRLELPNGAVGFGYRAPTVLSATVISPDEAAGRSLEFAAEVSWMACRQSCLRGTEKLQLRLEVAGEGVPATPTQDAAWLEHQLSLPRAPADGDGRQLSWKPGDGAAELRLTYDGATAIEYFPDLATSDRLVGSAVMPINGQSTLVVTVRGAADGSVGVGGVVKVVRGTEYAYHQLAEQMPRSAP